VFGLLGRPATVVGLLIGGVVVVCFLRWRVFVDWEFPEDYRADWLAFVLGAALLSGCFFTGTNFGYRWIFAIWLAPLLWRLPRDPRAPAQIRRLAAFTAALLIWGLWADGAASALLAHFGGTVATATLVRWADRFVLIEQPLLWLFFSALLGWLTHFTAGALRSLAKTPLVNSR
jgi:hypothetical protein